MPDDRIICTVHELNTYDWECFRPSKGGNSPKHYEDKPDMKWVAEIARKHNVDLGVAFAMCYGEHRYDDKTVNKAISDYYKSIGVTFDD